MVNYNVSHIQEDAETWKDDPVCLHSEMWYLFVIIIAFVYYLLAVLSMIFTKESRRLRQISILHDNVIMSIVFPSFLEWLTFTSKHFTTVTTAIHLSPHHKMQVATCGLINFLYTTFQTTSVVALAYVVYAEKCLLPHMNYIKPKPLCSVRLLALQVITGATVATATTLIDASVMNGSANGCCLHPVEAGSFKKTRDVVFNVFSIYAAYLLMRVSIDRFLKLLMTGHHRRPSTIIYNRLEIS